MKERLEKELARIEPHLVCVAVNKSDPHWAWMQCVVRMDGESEDNLVHLERVDKVVKSFNNYDKVLAALKSISAIEKLISDLPYSKRELLEAFIVGKIATRALEELDERAPIINRGIPK